MWSQMLQTKTMLFNPKFALSIALSFCFLVGTTHAATSLEEACAERVLVSETFIGKDKNVKMETFSCSASVTKRSVDLDARQTTPTNVCGANCKTFCFQPAGGGPNPNDCHIIADALRFDSQDIGAIFVINNGTNNTVALTYHSCESFFVNQDLGPLAYCRTDWAAVIDFVAPNCQATQNAHGGDCVATDQRWFIQVQTS